MPMPPITIRSLGGGRSALARAAEVNTYGTATAAPAVLRKSRRDGLRLLLMRTEPRKVIGWDLVCGTRNPNSNARNSIASMTSRRGFVHFAGWRVMIRFFPTLGVSSNRGGGVYQDTTHLHGPLALVLTPNGNLITTCGGHHRRRQYELHGVLCSTRSMGL